MKLKSLLAGWVLAYLRVLAVIKLWSIHPVVIGIGGASGKTSVTGFINTILSQRYKTRETKGKNSETGIPLSILGLELNGYNVFSWFKVIFLAPFKVFDSQKYEILIAEMGIDSPNEPKNMSYLLRIIKPKIGVLTNISFEHSENFDKKVSDKDRLTRRRKILELTAKEEGLLLLSLPKDGTAVINLDNNQIGKIQKKIKANIITVSVVNKNADFFIEKTGVSTNDFIVTFIHKENKYKIKIKNPLPLHFASSIMFSIAASSKFVSIGEAIKTLQKNFHLPPGRMNVFKGKKNTIILDSSYNSSPSSTADLLSLLDKISNKRRRVAIIGDMRELGSISQEEHESLAKNILETTDLAILIGIMTSKFTSPILAKNKHRFFSFPSFSKAKETIEREIAERDLILVKGSQNTLFLERVVEMLLKDKTDVKKLCRRGSFWDKQRALAN